MGQNKPPHSVEGMGSLPHPVRCSGGGVIYSLKKKNIPCSIHVDVVRMKEKKR